MSNSSGGGSCFGLLMLIGLLAALLAAYFWSQGMDPQSAVAAGLILSTKITTWLCALTCVGVTVVTGGLIWMAFRD